MLMDWQREIRNYERKQFFWYKKRKWCLNESVNLYLNAGSTKS